MTLFDYQPARKALALYTDMLTRKGTGTQQAETFRAHLAVAPGNDRALLLDAYTFGTLHSHLWKILEDDNHATVMLTPDRHALICWIDLNVPLWGDYAFRPERKKAHPIPNS